ncbi:hypothetical protein pdam_00020654 [Pocillopora damicornis]|uniref:Uncharacterized protein n=1 Tax=Pocillopora damicornis TaxID=46731 RepID=A0A3M6V586_POCDA|nr:serine/threonine-protein kinase SULU-like [Pocillopora damicornis]RMX61067.1 hypothetical protein pdam_00020654 [Pocillopora damicornis]
MVLPFERQPLLHKRYASLSSPELTRFSQGESGDASRGDEYANFLKSLANGERQDVGVSRPKPIAGKQGRSSPTTKDPKQTKYRLSPNRSDGLLHVTLTAKQNIQEHQKKMRVIEDHMLQHKQEERELKRYEGDIIKKQHHLRRTMAEYENSIYKKVRGEESKLSENNQGVERVKQQHAIQEDKVNKARTERNMSAIVKFKDKDRKEGLNLGEVEFQYSKTAKQLELTRTEIFSLTQQFEENLKRIEERGFELKKSLAELAIAANKMALKKRTQQTDDDRYVKDTSIKDIQDDRRRKQSLTEKLKGIENQGLKHEYGKRRLSRDLMVSKDMLSLKSREEGRKMTDINRRLQHNSVSQKQAKQAAEYLELDRQGKEIEERGQFAEARRSHQIEQLTRDRRQQHSQQMTEWKKRYLEKQNEATRRAHEDSVKHLQKIVNKMEETEHALYNRVRAAEMQRRKQEQDVQRIFVELEQLSKENQKKMRETQEQFGRKKVELEQKLLREKAELAKAHNQREESIQRLLHHRAKMNGDKYLLSEEEREHDRLAKIGQRTDNLEQEVHS